MHPLDRRDLSPAELRQTLETDVQDSGLFNLIRQYFGVRFYRAVMGKLGVITQAIKLGKNKDGKEEPPEILDVVNQALQGMISPQQLAQADTPEADALLEELEGLKASDTTALLAAMQRFKAKQATMHAAAGKAHRIIPKKYPNLGRNDPCPCGCGKKTKRCDKGQKWLKE